MNFEEYAAKPLLKAAGIVVPASELARSADEAGVAAQKIGPCVVKAQVPTGKRGKAGGIALAASQNEAHTEASRILGMQIGEHTVEKVLVEAQVPIASELYAAVLNDPVTKSPLILFSPEGGMDIEEIAENHPQKLMRLPVDIRRGFDPAEVAANLPDLGDIHQADLIALLEKLYSVYAANDAELLEINPLVLTTAGDLIALDCKFTLDDSGVKRQEELAEHGTPDKTTELEARSHVVNLKYIELEGNVGVLANGAGVTMTTMDAISHYGGSPANFLEIGGEAYRLSKEALEIVLANPNVKSLMVNFCGAFARCDVMAEGVVNAWKELEPDIPVFFTIHGTGEKEAIALVRDGLGLEPYEFMDDAVKAAVEAAQ